MRHRGCPAPPSATKDITTSSSQEGRKVRTDSIRQPFVPEHANGTGAVQISNPQPLDYSSPRAGTINNVHLVGDGYNNDGEFINQYQCL